MFVVRWAAAGFATLQVLAYEDAPYPENLPVFTLALATIAVLAAGNLAGRWALTRAATYRDIRTVALATLLLDVTVASSFVWLWTFDQTSALWAVLLILPLEGAIKFQLPGAVSVWALTVVLYTGREFWGSFTYEGFVLQWNSITFRMGIGFLIALVAGFMARDLVHQRGLAEATLEDLRRVDRIRSGLISTLAHDVRAPLGAIRGALRTLLQRGADLEPEVIRELLAGTDRQAGRMERLAADLLDLARLETGRLELSFQDVSLAETVAKALAYVEDGPRMEMRIDPKLRVRADPGRLEQIVVNLAVNATRHGREPFTVEAAGRNGLVTLTFTDHGDGIPEDQRETLFEPFRVDPESGSVGYGLAVVRALTEAHGGAVTYRDNDPRGACFEVTLPAAGDGAQPA
jgi:signal transduction histidine kinase